MTRSLAISQRQAQTLLRAAEAEGGIIEVKFGTTVIRLIPKSQVVQEAAPVDDLNPAAFETMDEYRAWRDKRADRD